MVSGMFFLLLVNFVFLFVCAAAQEEERVEVQSFGYGTFRGRVRRTEDGTGVNEFLGIQYGELPIGGKRFTRSSYFSSSTKTYDVIKMGPACPQYTNHPFPWYDSDSEESEDCLYLNIWAPADIGGQKRPVKIYVHGGGWFETGSTGMGYYDGFYEALDTKDENGKSRQDGIVVATMNYRLGPLGFLSSGTKDAPGNAGLHDIADAVNWITGQINAFGGDRDRVALVGQGSGSIAVSLFVPAFKWLPAKVSLVFNGASFLSLKALPGVDDQGDAKDNNVRLADELAKAVGCQTTIKDNPAATVKCLNRVNVTSLMSAMASISAKGPPNVFLPQYKKIEGIDGFFAFDPYRGLADFSRVAQMNISAAFTSDEGSHLLTTAYPKVFGVFGENDVPLSAPCAKLMTRRFLQKFNESDADKLLGDLDPQPTSENRKKVIQAFGDAYFTCPMVFFAESFTSYKNPVHFYMLEKRVFPPYNPWAEWMGSVDFNDVQIDFVHGDGQLTINKKTYKYNDEQMEQARFTKELVVNMANKQSLPYDEFTLDNPAYSVLDSDGKLSQEKNTNYHSRNCDILRPYFEFKMPE